MNSNEGPGPTLPESIPLESAKLWLAPQIFGMLILALVFMVLMPFWGMPPMFSLITAILVVVVLGMLWYMHRWRRRRDLTCAPDGLHITGVGDEHVVAWADITGVEIARNLHLGRSSVLVKLAGGGTVRQISSFVFSEVAAAEHARSAILTWQAAYACASPGTGAAPRWMPCRFDIGSAARRLCGEGRNGSAGGSGALGERHRIALGRVPSIHGAERSRGRTQSRSAAKPCWSMATGSRRRWEGLVAR